MAYVVIPSGDLDAESPIDTDLMTALARNPDEIAADDPAAPVFKGRVKSVSLSEHADANRSSTGALGIDSIASVAVTSDQTLLVWVTVKLKATPNSGSLSIDDITIKHDGTTLATRSVALTNGSMDVTIFATSSTAATGTLVVESGVTVTGGGGSPPVADSIDPQVFYAIINTP